MENTTNGTEVLEFDHGVRAYPPATPNGPWRLRWDEHHRRRETTAMDRTAAIAKAAEILDRGRDREWRGGIGGSWVIPS